MQSRLARHSRVQGESLGCIRAHEVPEQKAAVPPPRALRWSEGLDEETELVHRGRFCGSQPGTFAQDARECVFDLRRSLLLLFASSFLRSAARPGRCFFETKSFKTRRTSWATERSSRSAISSKRAFSQESSRIPSCASWFCLLRFRSARQPRRTDRRLHQPSVPRRTRRAPHIFLGQR